MDEFKFVLRCLLFTAVLMFISQYKMNNETLEAKAQYYFMDSPTAGYLREAAAGGVLFVRGTIDGGLGFIKSKMAQDEGEFHHEPTNLKSKSESRL